MSTWNKAAFLLAIAAFVLAVCGHEFLPRDGLFWSTWKLLILGPVASTAALLVIALPLDRMRAKGCGPDAIYTSFSQLVVMLGFVSLLVCVLLVPAANKTRDNSEPYQREATCVEFRRAGKVTHIQLLFADEPEPRKLRLSMENTVAIDAEFATGDAVVVTLSEGGLGLQRILSIAAK